MMHRFLDAILEPVLGKVTVMLGSIFMLFQGAFETGVFRLFDVAIALGIMAIVAFFVWKEYQKERKHGNDQSDTIRDLLVKVTDALNNSSRANEQSAKAIEQNSRVMEKLMTKVENIESHVQSQK